MPRHFRPVGGFADRSVSAVKLDDAGHSHHVFADGKEAPAEYIADKVNIARPTWSLTELENLVRSGKWEEFTPEPPAEQQAAPQAGQQHEPIEPQPQPEHPAADSTTVTAVDAPRVESQPQE